VIAETWVGKASCIGITFIEELIEKFIRRNGHMSYTNSAFNFVTQIPDKPSPLGKKEQFVG